MILIEEIKNFEILSKNNVKLHLDGARIWNASAETGISLKRILFIFR